MADEKKRAGFAIKTEIDPVIDDHVAYQILFGTNGNIKYPFASLTQVMEISEDDANYFFDVKDLSVRVHSCPYCGLSMDKDLNAAKNILRLGLQSVAKA